LFNGKNFPLKLIDIAAKSDASPLKNPENLGDKSN